VPVADVGCWLTGISGRWVSGSPNPLGWNNGALLSNDPAQSPFWHLTITNGRTAKIACIR
jgi:hypothetical protein